MIVKYNCDQTHTIIHVGRPITFFIKITKFVAQLMSNIGTYYIAPSESVNTNQPLRVIMIVIRPCLTPTLNHCLLAPTYKEKALMVDSVMVSSTRGSSFVWSETVWFRDCFCMQLYVPTYTLTILFEDNVCLYTCLCILFAGYIAY